MEKVREKSGEVKSGVLFQALNTPKLVFRPRWGSLWRSPKSHSQLGRGTPIPFPQLLQPQLLNNWLSGLTLFFINIKRRLLTISVNTRYWVIFACLYWKSQGISCGLESGHPVPAPCKHCTPGPPPLMLFSVAKKLPLLCLCYSMILLWIIWSSELNLLKLGNSGDWRVNYMWKQGWQVSSCSYS